VVHQSQPGPSDQSEQSSALGGVYREQILYQTFSVTVGKRWCCNAY